MAWMTILGLDWKGGRFAHPLDIVDVPQKPGVFKLHARLADGAWEVFYVGQASNLYSTLLAYMGTIVEGDPQAAGISPCAKARIATDEVAYSYAVVADETERKGCVRSLFEYYRPACNSPEQVPDVEGIACNPY
ncbi:nitrogen fixation protein FixH [Symbiobacterium terraclitae]|uniref:Nitrogen fixation protein FixH n=1 Tax=Symbiobacterium terraclitae TaxID=557451 RepID=A0ABS4JTZ3_9FIRM|nr:hypothetical protein [Symbiobacterium terraclitae]MBP2017929.1 nitrogen fixation protein FixH [Symbiobacterium terraclitae]